jgi:hypothetical protein
MLPEPTIDELVNRATCPGLPQKDALNLMARILYQTYISGGGGGGGGGGSGGFAIPNYDEYDFTYHGSTNNIATQVFSLNGSTVATLTFSYVGGVPVSDDALISNISLTLP